MGLRAYAHTHKTPIMTFLKHSFLKHPWLLPLIISPLGLIIPIAPRSGPLFILILGIAGIMHYLRRKPSLDWLVNKPMAALVIWLCYLFLTGLWSYMPERSFEQALRISLVVFFGLAGLSLIKALSDAQKQRVMACLIPAVIVGIIFGSIFGLLQYTGPYIRMITDFLGTSPEFSAFNGDNQRHVAKTMLLTNLAFFALLPWLWAKQKLIAFISYALLFSACFYSDSQSSLITCLVGGLVFLALRISKNIAPKLIIAGIVASFILIIPLTQSELILEARDSIKETSLGRKASPDARTSIYRAFSTQILVNPLFGHGLLTGNLYKDPSSNTELNHIPYGVRTPHNLHLQILFDIGFTGAFLMLIALIWPIGRLLKSSQREIAGVALLILCVAIAGTLFNFVIWRTWISSAAYLSFLFAYLNASQGITKQKARA